MIYRIIWRNTATKQVLVQTAIDASTTKTYYRFPVLADMPRGEYEYFVATAEGTLVLNENDIRKSTIDGEPIEVYDCGVAQVGEIARTDTTTYNTVKTYTQYGG